VNVEKFEHLEVTGVAVCMTFQHSTINCATVCLLEKTGTVCQVPALKQEQMLMAVEVQQFSGIPKPLQRKRIGLHVDAHLNAP
jgi:hypothetical protein